MRIVLVSALGGEAMQRRAFPFEFRNECLALKRGQNSGANEQEKTPKGDKIERPLKNRTVVRHHL
ncbi:MULTISPECIES: hypothetical protein [unclassified Ensifer]|uniref:hypothetical protein n=1 Tax=unclassified Ensifer TaxID=2633371 RepID=UPI001FCDC9DD|nr:MULTISPECIES: hypothetical protein [unclassified Ensifer]